MNYFIYYVLHIIVALISLTFIKHFAHFSVNDIFFRHGEKCAGIIGAVLNNSFCGVGMAYNAHLGGMSNHGKIIMYLPQSTVRKKMAVVHFATHNALGTKLSPLGIWREMV